MPKFYSVQYYVKLPKDQDMISSWTLGPSG